MGLNVGALTHDFNRVSRMHQATRGVRTTVVNLNPLAAPISVMQSLYMLSSNMQVNA